MRARPVVGITEVEAGYRRIPGVGNVVGFRRHDPLLRLTAEATNRQDARMGCCGRNEILQAEQLRAQR